MQKQKTFQKITALFFSLVLLIASVPAGVFAKDAKAASSKGYIISVEKYSASSQEFLLEPIRVDLGNAVKKDAIVKAFAQGGINDAAVVQKQIDYAVDYIDSIQGIKGDEAISGGMNDPTFGPKKWIVSFNNDFDIWAFTNWKPGKFQQDSVIRVIYTQDNGMDIGGVNGTKLNVNKDALLRAIADNKDSIDSKIYKNAKNTALSSSATQQDVDKALKDLNDALNASKKPSVPNVADEKGYIISVEKFANGSGSYLLKPTRIDLQNSVKRDAILKAFTDCGITDAAVVQKQFDWSVDYIDSINGIKGDEPRPGASSFDDPVFGPKKWMVAFNNDFDIWNLTNWKPGKYKENSVIRVVFTENNGSDMGGTAGTAFKVNKDELTRLIADARRKCPSIKSAIDEAEKVALDGTSQQTAVDNAVKALQSAMKEAEPPKVPKLPDGKGQIISIEKYTGDAGGFVLEPVRIDLGNTVKRDAILKAFTDCGIMDAAVVQKQFDWSVDYIDSINGIKGDEPRPGASSFDDPVFGPKKWMVAFNNDFDIWNLTNWKPGKYKENSVIRVVFTENNGTDMGGTSATAFKVNKDELTRLIADARMNFHPALSKAIKDAETVLLNGKADQKAVNDAVQALKEAIDKAPKPEKPILQSIKIENAKEQTVNINAIINFKAVKNPQDADGEITWSVDNQDLASIDAKTGVFTALKPGTVNVKANIGEVNSTVKVTIKSPATSVTIEPKGLSLRVNETKKIKATVLPEDSTDKVEYSVIETWIASVDQNGNVKGLQEGEATVVAIAGEQSAAITVSVREIPATDLALSESAISVQEGMTKQLTATLTPSDATTEVIWSVGDDSIANVDNKGLVTGVKTGATTVTATAGKLSKTCNVQVTEGPYVYFENEDGSIVKLENNLIELSALNIGKFKLANYQGEVTWECDYDVLDHNDSYTTEYFIKSDGTFAPYTLGNYTAKVYFGDKQKTFTLKVVSSGITELRMMVDGKVYDKENILSVKGASTVYVTVQARRNSKEEFFTIPNNRVIYETDSPLYAVINGNGKLDVKSGQSEIRALLKENIKVRSAFDVLVGLVHVDSIKVNVPEEFYIDKWNSLGGYYVGIQPYSGYQIVVTPSNATHKDVTWTALTPDIATHMEEFSNGIIPKRAGTAKFRVTSNDNPNASVEVSVKFLYKTPIQSVSMDKTEFQMQAGETTALSFNFVPSNPTEQRFDWSYSQKGIVRVDEAIRTDISGTGARWFTHDLVALKEGTVTVTGTPYDTTGGAKPVTFVVKVGNGGAVLPEQVDVDPSIRHGVKALTTLSKNQYEDEWTIFALMQSGEKLSTLDRETYIQSVNKALEKSSKLIPTDYSRIIFTLGMMGEDPRTACDEDIVAKMTCNKKLFRLTSNQIMWTLIGLDTKGYDIPQEAGYDRDKLIEEILLYQRSDGSFSLGKKDVTGSVDMTAMALQSLAPYKDRAEVKEAIDKGLEYLQSKLSADCTYDVEGGKNACSASQVITALTSLGLDPLDPENGFIRNGQNIISKTMEFEVEKGFALHLGQKDADLMSTQQVTYALQSYKNLIDKKDRIYDLSGIPTNQNVRSQLKKLVNQVNSLDNSLYTDESLEALSSALKEATRGVEDLNVEQDELAAMKKALENARKNLITKEEMANANRVDQLIENIGNVTLESEKAILDARKAYDSLSEKEKELVQNEKLLQEKEQILRDLKDEVEIKPDKPTDHQSQDNAQDSAPSTGDRNPLVYIILASVAGIAILVAKKRQYN